MSKVLMLVGPSGSGKSELEKVVLDKYDIHPMKIYTTRDRRHGEDTNIYNFVTLDKLSKVPNSIIYNALVPNLMYSISVDDIDLSKDYVMTIITKRSAKLLKDRLILSGIDVEVVYIEALANLRIQGMLDRGESNEQITARIMGEVMDMPINDLAPNILVYDYDYKIGLDGLVYEIGKLLHDVGLYDG